MSNYTLRSTIDPADGRAKWVIYGAAAIDGDDAPESLTIVASLAGASSEEQALNIVRLAVQQGQAPFLREANGAWLVDVDKAIARFQNASWQSFSGEHAAVPQITFGAINVDGACQLTASVAFHARGPRP